nr:MAG TPA: hypothetical protein [Caudoviricetes sp.]
MRYLPLLLQIREYILNKPSLVLGCCLKWLKNLDKPP